MGEYYVIRDSDYLEHHGILGQKWGVRRYQNPDGTRTNAGLKREKQYREGEIDNSGRVKRTPEENKEAWKIAAVVVGTAAVAASAVYVAKNKDNITKAVDNAMHNIRIQKAEKSLEKRSNTLAGQTVLAKMQIKTGAVAAGLQPKFDALKTSSENTNSALKTAVSEQVSNYGMSGKVDAKEAIDRFKTIKENSNFTVKPSNATFTYKPSNATVTRKSSNATVTYKPSNATVTRKSSNSTTTYRPSNATVTRKASNATVTYKPSNATVTRKSSNVATPNKSGNSVANSKANSSGRKEASKLINKSSSGMTKMNNSSVEKVYKDLDDYTSYLLKKNSRNSK